MDTYTKEFSRHTTATAYGNAGTINEGWAIFHHHKYGKDEWSDLIAVVDTETLADIFIAALENA